MAIDRTSANIVDLIDAKNGNLSFISNQNLLNKKKCD